MQGVGCRYESERATGRHAHTRTRTHTHTHTHTHAFAHVHSLSLDRWVGKHDENAVDQDANENEVVEDGAGLNVSADPRMHHINTATPKGLVRTGGTCMLPHCLRSEKKHRFSLVLHSLFLPSSFARFSPFPPLHTHTHIHTHAHTHTHTLSLSLSFLPPSSPFVFCCCHPQTHLMQNWRMGLDQGKMYRERPFQMYVVCGTLNAILTICVITRGGKMRVVRSRVLPFLCMHAHTHTNAYHVDVWIILWGLWRWLWY